MGIGFITNRFARGMLQGLAAAGIAALGFGIWAAVAAVVLLVQAAHIF